MHSSVDPSSKELQFVDRFIVCGLGSLGQYCVLNLKRFGIQALDIHLTAIDRVQPTEWEVHDFPNLLNQDLILGDCREDAVLLQAGIQDCRTILLVTSNDTVNVETALAARRLNPNVRLVVRSSRQNLNQLLQQRLGNFVAFEPTELPATAFALAGLNADILGYFKIGDCQLQVIEQQVQPKDYRFDRIPAALLHKKTYRLLSHQSATETSAQRHSLISSERTFNQWLPDTQVQAGDRIAYIELIGKTSSPLQSQFNHSAPPANHAWSLKQGLQNWLGRHGIGKISQVSQWLSTQRNAKAISLGLLLAFCLWSLGSVLLKIYLPHISWMQAISKGAILLLGGYGDLFGDLGPDAIAIPDPVNLVFLGITLTSVLFLLSVFGLIADSLLSTRFDFLAKRPPIPQQNHIVIVGFGRIGQRAAQILKQFRQPVVVITEQLENAKAATDIPLLIGDLTSHLERVNLATAKGIMVLTDDQMLNLEVALMARDMAQRLHRKLGLVVRTYGQRFSDNLHQLLPEAKVMAAYALSAEAFAGAAFGENILGLFRLNNRTILVTEYLVAENDTLVDRLLAEVAYGYGVMPIFHQKANHPSNQDIEDLFMPSDDVKLQVGDRLIVLASLNGLRRIEHGDRWKASRWKLVAQKPLNTQSLLDASSLLYRISGCHLDTARAFMNSLPNSLELDLYEQQAYRLAQELNRYLPIHLQPLSPSRPS